MVGSFQSPLCRRLHLFKLVYNPLGRPSTRLSGGLLGRFIPGLNVRPGTTQNGHCCCTTTTTTTTPSADHSHVKNPLAAHRALAPFPTNVHTLSVLSDRSRCRRRDRVCVKKKTNKIRKTATRSS